MIQGTICVGKRLSTCLVSDPDNDIDTLHGRTVGQILIIDVEGKTFGYVNQIASFHVVIMVMMAGVGVIKSSISVDMDFAQQPSLHEQAEGVINGRLGELKACLAQSLVQLFCGDMLMLDEERVRNRQPLRSGVDAPSAQYRLNLVVFRIQADNWKVHQASIKHVFKTRDDFKRERGSLPFNPR